MSKVVAIDDEPFILMMIERKLKMGGIEVIALRESKDALRTIREEKPDLIILDWMMPHVTGIDLCRTLKADAELRDIPVFLLTGKGQDADLELALQCGATMYITKPFSPKELLENVRRTIRSG